MLHCLLPRVPTVLTRIMGSTVFNIVTRLKILNCDLSETESKHFLLRALMTQSEPDNGFQVQMNDNRQHESSV